MRNGTVKFFQDDKGFGFVVDAETGEEFFVHVSGTVDEIRKDDKVTFDTEEGRKGINAVNVRRA